MIFSDTRLRFRIAFALHLANYSRKSCKYDCSNVIRRLYIISVYICTSSYHHCELIVEAAFANYIIA